MQIHHLKSWPEWFAAVRDGTKTFETRLDDRGFEVSDVLVLEEFDPETEVYSGRSISCRVTYLIRGSDRAIPIGIQPGFVVMSIKRAMVQVGMPDANA